MLSIVSKVLTASQVAGGEPASFEQALFSAKKADAGPLRQELEGAGRTALEFLAQAGSSALDAAQERSRDATEVVAARYAEVVTAVTDNLAQTANSALSLAQDQAQTAGDAAWACVAEVSAGVVENLLAPAAASAVELAADAAMEVVVEVAVHVAAETVGALL